MLLFPSQNMLTGVLSRNLGSTKVQLVYLRHIVLRKSIGLRISNLARHAFGEGCSARGARVVEAAVWPQGYSMIYYNIEWHTTPKPRHAPCQEMPAARPETLVKGTLTFEAAYSSSQRVL